MMELPMGFSTYTSLPAEQASVIAAMPMVGRANDDRIDVFIFQQLTVIAIRFYFDAFLCQLTHALSSTFLSTSQRLRIVQPDFSAWRLSRPSPYH